MALLTKPSSAARTSITYITVGALIVVWTVIWYLYLGNLPTGDVRLITWYICYGSFFTGLVLLLIGLLIGHIGRSARTAELPPAEATATQAQIDQQVAAQGVNPNVAGAATGFAAAPPSMTPVATVASPAPAATPVQASPPAVVVPAGPLVTAGRR